MKDFIKSLFKPSIVQVHNIEDLFPLYDPDNFVIGIRKGCLDKVNRVRLLQGLPFEFTGDRQDFVILPKSNIKEQNETVS